MLDAARRARPAGDAFFPPVPEPHAAVAAAAAPAPAPPGLLRLLPGR
ncbi:hypothetical protein [Baekduia soli]|nr:hypothetical protein [Baekduia soli]